MTLQPRLHVYERKAAPSAAGKVILLVGGDPVGMHSRAVHNDPSGLGRSIPTRRKNPRILLALCVTGILFGAIGIVNGSPAMASSTFSPIAKGDIVASLANGQVNEYSPSGSLVQTLITNASTPTGSAFDGAGNLYVTEFTANDILKVDASTGAVSVFSNNSILGDGTSFVAPESIAFGPGYKQMYVSDANRDGANGGIHVIDTATGKGAGFFPLPSSMGSDGAGESDWLAFNHAGTLFMTNENPAQGIMQVDPSTKDIVQPSFVANLPTYGYALSFDADGNLWLSDTSSILEYDPSGKLINTITNSNFQTVFSAVFNPPYNTVYAGDLSSGNIFTYDLHGNLLNTFNVGSGVDGLSVAGTIVVPSPIKPPHLNLGDYKIAGTAQEPSMAVDPANPRHVVIGYNSHTFFGNFHCSFATTWDGGSTWSLGTLGSVQGQGGLSDPSVVFAPNGHIFYACITERTKFPSFFKDWGVGIYMSKNGGKSFTGVSEAATGVEFDNPFSSKPTETMDDQESLAVGGDGRLHVCATQYNTSSGNIYVEVYDSTDATGSHWRAAKAIPTGPRDNTLGCGIAVTGTGRVWVSWWDANTNQARVAYRDGSAGRWSAAITIGAKSSEEAGRQVRLAADPRANATGVIAIWPSTSDGHNVATLAYTTDTAWYGDCGAQDASPCFASDANSDIDEPAVSWGADGRILIGYYKVSGNAYTYVIGRAEGINQPFGFTTAASAATDPSAYSPFNRLGDYTSVAEGSDGSSYAAWSDTRSGKQELWGAS